MNIQKPAPQGAAENAAGSELSKINEIAKYVQNFADFGLINNEQKDFLCQNINAAMDKLNARKGVSRCECGGNDEFLTRSTTMATCDSSRSGADVIDFERLSDDENNFFESRKNLKAYLSEAGVTLKREEFEKIFALVNELEKQAVQRFEEFLKGQEILKQSNEAAKQKLQTASAAAFGGPVDVAKKFTPEQIGAMSAAQFRANEHLINEQIRSGDFRSGR